MAGFAILFDPGSSSLERENEFKKIYKLTAKYKQLETSSAIAAGKYCTAAKLDSPSSLHRGIHEDKVTGSWIFATGTLVSLRGDNDPSGILSNFLTEYLRIGEKVLDDYDGHFAIVIYNGIDENLSVISDPMGQFSIFLGKLGTRIFISTSVLAVVNLIHSKPDIIAVDSFLRAGKSFGERTFWQDVKRVRPATIQKFYYEKTVISEYWTPHYNESIAHYSLTNALGCAEELLKNTMTRLLQREGLVWADLTGGFDSRVTTMLMEKINIPFIAYCVGPENHPDSIISKLISQEMGWKYQHLPLPDSWGQDQLGWLETALYKGDACLGLSSLARTLWGQIIRSNTSRVSVTGLGGDEWREAAYTSLNLFNYGKVYPYNRLIRAGILFPLPESIMRENREDQVFDAWRTYLDNLVSDYKDYSSVLKGNIMFVRFRYPSHGGAYLSASSGISRSLSPFCFKETSNFALSINPMWRINYHSSFMRAFLERGNPRLANLPTEKGGPAIPIRITNVNRFWPLWKKIFNHMSRRMTTKILHKPISFLPTTSYENYPLQSWQQDLFKYASKEDLFTISKMHSGALYNPERMKFVTNQALSGISQSNEFLERVITIEMALRATGTEIE